MPATDCASPRLELARQPSATFSVEDLGPIQAHWDIYLIISVDFIWSCPSLWLRLS